MTWLLRQHKPCWTPTPCGQCAIRLSMERWRAGFPKRTTKCHTVHPSVECWLFCNLLLTFCNVRNLLNILRFKCLRGAVFDFVLVRVVCLDSAWPGCLDLLEKLSALEKRNKSRLQGKGPMCFGEMSLLAEFDSFLLTSQPWRSRCFQNVCLFFRRSLDDVD